jgi:glycosyltransferase involved in cell wall biosynthesis
MNDPTVITVVTPSFNQGAFLGETLSSVIGQEGPFFLDYVVVDGASSDCSVETLRQNAERFARSRKVVTVRDLPFHQACAEVPWIHCRGISFRWLSEADRGQTDAINKGLRLAVGDVFAFLNSDDTYFPGALSRIARFDWDDADFVYGNGMWIAKDGTHLLPYPTFRPTRQNFAYQCTLCQPSVFLKRSAYARLGEFATAYHVAFDFEYWMRALSLGMRFKYVDEFLATSRFHPENKSMAQASVRQQEVSALRSMYQSAPKTLLETIERATAKFIVHRRTVAAAKRLHELIGCRVSQSV